MDTTLKISIALAFIINTIAFYIHQDISIFFSALASFVTFLVLFPFIAVEVLCIYPAILLLELAFKYYLSYRKSQQTL